jgi:hypothetical protein
MRKLIIPDSGEMLVGSLRESVHGMADGDVVLVTGGRYVDAPEPVDEVSSVNADAEPVVTDGAAEVSKPRKGRRS